MNSRQHYSNRGKYLVLFLVGISFLAAVGTYWNYSRHVFSTRQALVIDVGASLPVNPRVKASFPPSITAKLHPGQYAKITLKSAPNLPLSAEIVEVTGDDVILQLLEKPSSVDLGEPCEVTVDTTIPVHSLP